MISLFTLVKVQTYWQASRPMPSRTIRWPVVSFCTCVTEVLYCVMCYIVHMWCSHMSLFPLPIFVLNTNQSFFISLFVHVRNTNKKYLLKRSLIKCYFIHDHFISHCWQLRTLGASDYVRNTVTCKRKWEYLIDPLFMLRVMTSLGTAYGILVRKIIINCLKQTYNA